MNFDWFKYFLEESNELCEKMEQTERAWDSFIQNQVIDQDCLIPPEILSSWRRCRERGLDSESEEMVILAPEEIESRLKKNKHILDIMGPIINGVADTITFSGHRIEFYDEELNLLMRFGKKKEDKDRVIREIEIGASAKESDLGTTAICLAALLESPMYTTCKEHYKDMMRDYSCTAVPIMSNENKLVGIIASFGRIWPLHKHTMGMLLSLKREIESRLFGVLLSESVELISKVNIELLENLLDAVLVVDRKGEIVLSNRNAYKLLFPNWESVLGFSCETILGKGNSFQEVLESKTPIIEKEMYIDVNEDRKSFQGTIKPIFGQDSHILGALGIIKQNNKNGNYLKKEQTSMKAQYEFDDVIGNSMAMQQAVRLAQETAKMENNVLIQGESGTGKEVFAQAIHNANPEKDRPFVAINCAAIPHGLLESELFGYVGGAFTGAHKDGSKGKFEIASGGTIFLDEINSMPLDMQVKILRAIQTKRITRVGADTETPIDVRIISASNVDLWELVKKEKFREDLYYRINVISIHIPPLRERLEDIEVLTDFILHKMEERYRQNIYVTKDAIARLKSYDWPGNVRELENVLERSFVIAQTNGTNKITRKEISDYLEMLGFDELQHSFNDQADLKHEDSEQKPSKILKRTEGEIIKKTLSEKKGNVKATAQALGISRNTLYRKMKQLGIEPDRSLYR